MAPQYGSSIDMQPDTRALHACCEAAYVERLGSLSNKPLSMQLARLQVRCCHTGRPCQAATSSQNVRALTAGGWVP